MAEVLLFHHIAGRTSGIREFADRLRAAGHTVHEPDYFEGRVFGSIEEGAAHVEGIGFAEVADRAAAFAEGLPAELVYAGFSLGVVPAQRLAQTRPGARGALLYEGFVRPAQFGGWPAGLPVQIHGMSDDPFFAGEGDLDAAREFVEVTPGAELFVYPGDGHLFADPSLASYDERAATLLLERTLAFLAWVG